MIRIITLITETVSIDSNPAQSSTANVEQTRDSMEMHPIPREKLGAT